MAQPTVLLLLGGALLLPLLAATAIRLLGPRLNQRAATIAASVAVTLALASALALARADVTRLEIGGLTLLAPIGDAGDTMPSP